LVWFRVRVSTFQHTPRQYLEENAHLIEAILQNQNLGRLKECVHYQQQLQQNLIFLATHADDHPELRPLIFTVVRGGPARAAGSRGRRCRRRGSLQGSLAARRAPPR